jgi:hypothetical protein
MKSLLLFLPPISQDIKHNKTNWKQNNIWKKHDDDRTRTQWKYIMKLIIIIFHRRMGRLKYYFSLANWLFRLIRAVGARHHPSVYILMLTFVLLIGNCAQVAHGVHQILWMVHTVRIVHENLALVHTFNLTFSPATNKRVGFPFQ